MKVCGQIVLLLFASALRINLFLPLNDGAGQVTGLKLRPVLVPLERLRVNNGARGAHVHNLGLPVVGVGDYRPLVRRLGCAAGHVQVETTEMVRAYPCKHVVLLLHKWSAYLLLSMPYKCDKTYLNFSSRLYIFLDIAIIRLLSNRFK